MFYLRASLAPAFYVGFNVPEIGVYAVPPNFKPQRGASVTIWVVCVALTITVTWGAPGETLL